MIELRTFSYKEQLPHLQELFVEHWEEIASDKQSRQLNPANEYFIALEEVNHLLCVGVFDGDKIVGYSVNVLAPDTHDCTKLLCMNDALYLSPNYRQGTRGIRLIKETEKQAKNRGIYGVLWHAKPNTSLDLLLDKMNYNVKDLLYIKEV